MRGLELRWPLSRFVGSRGLDLVNFEQKCYFLAAGLAVATLDVRGTGGMQGVPSGYNTSMLSKLNGKRDSTCFDMGTCISVIVAKTCSAAARCPLAQTIAKAMKSAHVCAGASYGRYRIPWASEQHQDAYDVIDFICSQPWSNQKVIPQVLLHGRFT